MVTLQSGSQEPKLIVGVVALCVVVFVLFQKISVYIAQQRFIKEHGCKPIKNRMQLKDPFLGLDMMFENIRNAKAKKFLEGVYKRNQKYGPTFATKLTTVRGIMTIEPENVKTVLSLRFKDYSLGNRGPMQALFGLGIFTTDGERWANSRHMIRPNFARDQVADLTAFERHVQDMFKLIPRDGTTVDLQELFFRLTIDSATEFLFGESVNSLKNNAAEFAHAFNGAQHEMAMLFRLGFFGKFRRNQQAQESIRICHEFVDKFVDDALHYRATHDLEKAPKEEKYVFLHELAKFTGDKRRLRDELLNVLLAGRDTTASLLSNMFFEIAKRPDIFAKLRAEVEELNGRIPTYEQLRNMKYVKWCMNESLRIHPVVPGNSRLAIRDTVLPLGGGPDGRSPVFVPKGTLVGYSVFSMHRRKDFYGEDSEEFRPERWETLRPSWEYLPFNGGPRICLGQQYALTEASYVTVRILQEFKAMESRDPGPWEESLTLTLCSANGTMVGLTPA